MNTIPILTKLWHDAKQVPFLALGVFAIGLMLLGAVCFCIGLAFAFAF